MQLIFVHGWGVTNTETYGELPEAMNSLAAGHGLDLNIHHIFLGRYISFHDEVSMSDIARAFDQALRDTIPDNSGGIMDFSCITHSTGGPVAREWLDDFYGADKLGSQPLRHLIMLAPANHGSALGALGKKRVGRIKAWAQGIEPGQRVLDWLSLGSDGQWRLNERSMAYTPAAKNYFPFVLIGQTIDTKFYDFLNSYLVEVGSDGVIRVAGANMNYGYVRLVQTEERIRKRPVTYKLKHDDIRKPEQTPLGVIENASHSGKKIGIMNSVKISNAQEKPVVEQILQCLKVTNEGEYSAREEALRIMTENTQRSDPKGDSKYMMFVFCVTDDYGNPVDDYEILILAGNRYDPSKLEKHFFVDKQQNASSPQRLIYYVNADKMMGIKDGKIGFRIIARPEKGFTHYAAAEFRSEHLDLSQFIRPNETLYVDIRLRRRVAKNTFVLGPVADKPLSFKKAKPSNGILD